MSDRAPHPIRMVCFDAGGVLVRICRSWREGCEAAGVPYRWSDRAEAGESVRREINDAYQRGELACDGYYEGMASSSGGLYVAAEIRAVHEAWILDEYPGVRGLIDRLNKAEGLSSGVLSNTSPSHWAQPHMLGGRGVSAVGSVEHPHASHLLGFLKPGVEIYRAFERETGFGPGEILFFDDLAENVQAARAIGWHAEVIDHTAVTAPQIVGHLQHHGIGL